MDKNLLRGEQRGRKRIRFRTMPAIQRRDGRQLLEAVTGPEFFPTVTSLDISE